MKKLVAIKLISVKKEKTQIAVGQPGFNKPYLFTIKVLCSRQPGHPLGVDPKLSALQLPEVWLFLAMLLTYNAKIMPEDNGSGFFALSP